MQPVARRTCATPAHNVKGVVSVAPTVTRGFGPPAQWLAQHPDWRAGHIVGYRVRVDGDDNRKECLTVAPEDVEIICDEPRPPGPVLESVRADIEAMGELSGGAQRSLAALAVFLAEAIDNLDDDSISTATRAKIGQELRATLVALTTKSDTRAQQFAELLTALSTPDRGRT